MSFISTSNEKFWPKPKPVRAPGTPSAPRVSEKIVAAIERVLQIPDSEMDAYHPPMQPMERIIAEVADKHGLTVLDLKSQRRSRMIVVARQEAMYRCRHETGQSLTSIARRFGGRDHTTVVHGVRRHAARIAEGKA